MSYFAKGFTQDMAAKSVGSITFAGLSAGACIAASGATKTVLAKTVVPGAIKSIPVIINGVPYVYSLVKASLFSKILLGGVLVAGAAVCGVMVYGLISKSK
jgi:hypothetical protein